MNVLEHFPQPISEFFLAEPRQIALAPESRAAIVGVSVLFDFRRHGAVVVGATKQARKCEVVLSVFGFVVAPENFLHLLEQRRANQRRVRPAVQLVFPNELAFVKRILEQAFEIAFRETHTKFGFESLT